jgi:hypothetical protein
MIAAEPYRVGRQFELVDGGEEFSNDCLPSVISIGVEIGMSIIVTGGSGLVFVNDEGLFLHGSISKVSFSKIITFDMLQMK